MFNHLMFMILFSTTLSLILSMISHRLPARLQDQEKLSPYECGFDPMNPTRLPFSLRFFLMAILFILFDLEIALLLALPSSASLLHPMQSLTVAFLLLIMLTMGLIYEWWEGGLDWAE
uniref:NADH-ubiquinone oxidoreductase chain 3 n=1 Tax=Stereobalanus canadensis TaxID=560612 RepID=A0A3S7SG37_9BILA|nr:NADH dehydrogenase subunit 3 [Stereobalanus canadensis]AXY64128.1 NADH dehydrogenase subunit 3 [Stereobalanus canadensis]